MVECYSGLYEEGEVDHINCPHPPSQWKGGANQRPTWVTMPWAYIVARQVGGWAEQELLNYLLSFKLAVN